MGINETRVGVAAWRRIATALLIGTAAAQSIHTHATNYDRTARTVAGLEFGLKGFGKEEEDQWRAAAREIGQFWSAYERRIGSPMRQWGCQELASAEGRTVFYPFSGPDLPSVALLYPDASRYAMISMQRAGPPPDLDALSGEQLTDYLVALRKAWKSYGTLGYFRTDDLEADRKSAGPRLGVTGPLMAFAARLDYVVQRVEPIQLDITGSVTPLTGEAAKSSTWHSARLHLTRDRKTVVVDYLSMNLSDSALEKNEAARLAVAQLAANPVMLKAASHLPQKPYFSIVRNHLVAKAASIVQDETGIEYAMLVEAFGTVRLYGKFTAPHRMFDRNWQTALAAAYKDDTKSNPLPFKLGYEKRSGSAVQVALRQGSSQTMRRTCPTLE